MEEERGDDSITQRESALHGLLARLLIHSRKASATISCGSNEQRCGGGGRMSQPH
jgi:hypothetical protein